MERYEKRHNAMLIRQHGELQLVMAEIRRKSKGRPYSPNPYEVKVLEQLEGNPDYTQNCFGSSGEGAHCGISTCQIAKIFCLQLDACTGTCTCPAPLENSHEVSDGCTCTSNCSNFPPNVCPEATFCLCAGVCGYDCDAGFEWNGEECVLVVVEVEEFGDGLTLY